MCVGDIEDRPSLSAYFSRLPFEGDDPNHADKNHVAVNLLSVHLREMEFILRERLRTD